MIQRLLDGKEGLSVIGLGYVGLPIAVAFSERKIRVIGFDLNKEKIEAYRSGKDVTQEVGDERLRKSEILYSADPSALEQALVHIVAVPTPVYQDHIPNLEPVMHACRLLGEHMKKGALVIFESTVYPGVTENICIREIEKISGLRCGADFSVGYSPERINPGDKVHTLSNICKIVSGIDEETTAVVDDLYKLIVRETAPVSSIKTAEAIKVVENSQRDINIAFMNELAMVFDKMGIDTKEVLEGMNTKWNALHFSPGLVGGHCIGVDPYYFIYEAERLGYHSQIILSGRKINDSMGQFVADAAIKEMILAGLSPKNARVGIMGITFKENCADVRNTKVIDIIKRLSDYGISPIIYDPLADRRMVEEEYAVVMGDISELKDLDCLIIAVAHDVFKTKRSEEIEGLFKQMDNEKKVIIDVKSILDKSYYKMLGYHYWRL